MCDANENCFNECAFRPGEAWISCWAVRLLVLKAKKTRFSLFSLQIMPVTYTVCLQSNHQAMFLAFQRCILLTLNVKASCYFERFLFSFSFHAARYDSAAVLIWLKRVVQWPNPNKTNSPIPETSSISWQRGNWFCNFRFEMRVGEINVIKKIVAVAGWHNREREFNRFSLVAQASISVQEFLGWF